MLIISCGSHQQVSMCDNLFVNLSVCCVIRLVVYECGVGDLAAMAAQVPRLSTALHYCEQWLQTLLSSQLSVDRSASLHCKHH